MAEAKDPAIKLFGRTIGLPDGQQQTEEAAAVAVSEPAGDWEVKTSSGDTAQNRLFSEACQEVSNSDVKDPNPDVSKKVEKSDRSGSSSVNNANREIQQVPMQDLKQTTDQKPEQEQNEADAAAQEKVLKKPDKILPCPRCNSMDTKFCYYNNYNVNQPRHFCKNCQRYWTAGGVMRNVPIGAGRRKNKHTSQYRQLISDGMMTATKVEVQESAHHQPLPGGIPARPLKVNESVLKFGPEAPLCESIASMLHLREQKRNTEQGTVVCGENMEEHSCASSDTTSNCVEKGLPDKCIHSEQTYRQSYCNGVTHIRPFQCYPGPPWAYPWVPALSAGQCSSDLAHGLENSSPTPLPWGLPPMVTTPGFCASAYPFPFMPASIWGCMSSWPGAAWNVPWVGPNAGLSPSSSTSIKDCSGNGSPRLGKHNRDSNLLGDEKMEKSLWAPKTLRIDDPDEAAKSSIWATLGIKRDEGGIFKTLQTKAATKTQTSDASQVLQANPAALSRSQAFQEST